ncbi:MAG: hypothetical protein HY438_02660 [DPANN group archaeon]|nr:hypothetical protein [DPANN group archaeon]
MAMVLTGIKRSIVALAASLTLFAPALAAKPTAAVQDALGTAFTYLCPNSDALQCPTLDFITAFGIVFGVILLGLYLVPQFKDAEGPAKAALTLIAVFMGLGTAIYVWFQKIPFTGFIAPMGLFLTAIVLALIAANVLLAMRTGEMSSAHYVLVGGLVLFIAGIALYYFGQPDWGAMLGLIGVFGLVIGGVMIGMTGRSEGASLFGGGGGAREADVARDVAGAGGTLHGLDEAAATPDPTARRAAETEEWERLIAEMGDIVGRT